MSAELKAEPFFAARQAAAPCLNPHALSTSGANLQCKLLKRLISVAKTPKAGHFYLEYKMPLRPRDCAKHRFLIKGAPHLLSCSCWL